MFGNPDLPDVSAGPMTDAAIYCSTISCERQGKESPVELTWKFR
jgi:hypothetical protein